MRVSVYVDGFNLYYGAIRGTKFHWLNIGRMCELLLNEQITSIRYCSAMIIARDNDPEQQLRQQIYLRALRTLPNLSISLGNFQVHNVMMRLSHPASDGSLYAKVIKTEEKGSDVNLATHLLHDAHLNRYDTAVLISNDSDLIEPLRIVRNELGKKVGVLNPQKHPCKAIVAEVDFFKQIRAGVLAASQFPHELRDANGTFHCPDRWK